MAAAPACASNWASASTTPTTTAASTGANAAATTTKPSGNYGPRQTAHAGLGAIGGIVAAAMLL